MYKTSIPNYPKHARRRVYDTIELVDFARSPIIILSNFTHPHITIPAR